MRRWVRALQSQRDLASDDPARQLRAFRRVLADHGVSTTGLSDAQLILAVRGLVHYLDRNKKP